MKVSMNIVASSLVSLFMAMVSGCSTIDSSASGSDGDYSGWGDSSDDIAIDWSRLNFLTNRVSLFTVEA